MFKKFEKILNEAFGKKYSLTEADKVQVTAPTFANKESDFNIKSMIKSKQGEVEAQRKADAEAKHKEELRQKYAGLIDKVQSALDENQNIDDVVHILFEELVPAEGPCETVAGELIRAISRIGYRDWNDGDVFYEGYGIETCGPAVSYIIDNIDGMFDKFDNIAKALLKDEKYTEAIENIAKDIVNYIIDNPETLETPVTKEMFDYNFDWIYRDWEPKYDFDIYMDYPDLEEHIDAGHISYKDFYYFIDEILSNSSEFSGANIHMYSSDSYVVENLTAEGFDELERYFDYWVQDWIDELNEEYPLFDEDEENEGNDEEFDESCKSRKNKKSIKESFDINTVADFFKFNGYADVDAYDEDWDYGTAIVWEGEKPSDGYDRFVDWFVKNTNFVQKVDDITIIVGYGDLVNRYRNAIEKFCNENNRAGYTFEEYDDEQDQEEVGILTLISMLEGNYSDSNYDEFLALVR